MRLSFNLVLSDYLWLKVPDSHCVHLQTLNARQFLPMHLLVHLLAVLTFYFTFFTKHPIFFCVLRSENKLSQEIWSPSRREDPGFLTSTHFTFLPHP